MHWNYRAVKDSHGWISIREVYYGDEGEIVAWTESPISPGGETIGELIADYDRMEEVFSKPVLDERELEIFAGMAE